MTPAKPPEEGAPPPVVLVIGEFGGPDTSSSGASSRAWATIADDVSENCQHPEVLREIERVSDGLSEFDTAVNVLRDHANKGCMAPMPMKVDIAGYVGPGDQRDALRLRLQGMLRRFNVVGVIACGTARATTATVDALAPLDIPTVLTLSSATHASNGGAAPLQLMPNNALQAHAILAVCDRILSDKALGRDIHLLAAPRGDAYVDSLVVELTDLGSANYGYDFNIVRLPEADLSVDAPQQVLICVGYDDVVKKAQSIAKSFEYIVLSDGCPDLVLSAPKILRSHPLATPAQFALDAWHAFQTAHRDTGCRTDVVEPRLRLTPTIDRVRNDLTARHGYKFAGYNNIRHGFVVRSIEPTTGDDRDI